MSEWRDFLEGLGEEEVLIIELTLALNMLWIALGQNRTIYISGWDTKDIEQKLEAGKEFTRKYVKDLV